MKFLPVYDTVYIVKSISILSQGPNNIKERESPESLALILVLSVLLCQWQKTAGSEK